MPNPLHTDIPGKVTAEVQGHLETIEGLLAPHLLSFTPEERKTVLRIADKTVAFVTKISDYATCTPAFVPS